MVSAKEKAEVSARAIQVTARVDSSLALPDRAQRLGSLFLIYSEANEMDRNIMIEFMMRRLANAEDTEMTPAHLKEGHS